MPKSPKNIKSLKTTKHSKKGAAFVFQRDPALKICDNTVDNGDLLCASDDNRDITVWKLEKDDGAPGNEVYLKNTDTDLYLTADPNVNSVELVLDMVDAKTWMINLDMASASAGSVLRPKEDSSLMLCAEESGAVEMFSFAQVPLIDGVSSQVKFDDVSNKCYIEIMLL
jgi:hypothetical protein